MNWLAHLYLSEPTPQFRVGNLLPDLASASRLAGLQEPYQKGIRCHRRIDSFTDTHPRVKACGARFPAPYRRFGGVLTDVYFDHFLARDWVDFSRVPLREFIREVYRDIEVCSRDIPVEAALPLFRLQQEDWLGSYDRIAGIKDILSRISRRLRRPFDLSGSLPIFTEQETAFLDDFRAFFPELIAHVRAAPSATTRIANAVEG